MMTTTPTTITTPTTTTTTTTTTKTMLATQYKDIKNNLIWKEYKIERS